MPGPVNPLVPGVQITNNGVEIADGTSVRATLGIITPAVPANGATPAVAADYGLKILTKSGSFVILDGVSALWNVAATGTLIPGAPGAGAQTQATATLSTGLTYTPASSWFVAIATGDQPLPYYIWNLATLQVNFSYEGIAVNVNTNQTKVTASQNRGAGTGVDSSLTFRYYVFSITGV